MDPGKNTVAGSRKDTLAHIFRWEGAPPTGEGHGKGRSLARRRLAPPPPRNPPPPPPPWQLSPTVRPRTTPRGHPRLAAPRGAGGWAGAPPRVPPRPAPRQPAALGRPSFPATGRAGAASGERWRAAAADHRPPIAVTGGAAERAVGRGPALRPPAMAGEAEPRRGRRPRAPRRGRRRQGRGGGRRRSCRRRSPTGAKTDQDVQRGTQAAKRPQKGVKKPSLCTTVLVAATETGRTWSAART